MKNQPDQPSPPKRRKEEKWVRVKLGEAIVWVEERTLKPGGNGPLSPESHIVDGKLAVSACFGSETYAHCDEDGTIRRFGKEIGRREDLVLAPLSTNTNGEQNGS